MNSRILIALFFGCFTLIHTNADAAYTGLSAEIHAVDGIPGYTTYRVYANFDDVNDQLVSIYGYDLFPINITTTGDFYQDPNGGPLSSDIASVFFPLVPELEYDSWVTIAAEDNSVGGLNSVGIDYTNFEAGGDLVVNDFVGGAWFVLPNTVPEAFATTGRVLVAQLTTNGDLSFAMNVQWRDASNGDNVNDGETLSVAFSLPGCNDPAADNYNPNATEDDGSCIFPAPSFTDLSYELVASDAVAGFDTYRVYANFTNPLDQVVTIFGQDVTPLSISTTGTFYQDALGGGTSSSINAGAFGSFPSLEYDSWVTIGTEAAPNNLNEIGLDVSSFEGGGALEINDAFGGGWFVIPDAEPEAFPDAMGRVLLGQFTTDGIVTFSVAMQYRAQDGLSYIEQPSITFPDMILGCTDVLACNYDASATDDDNSCILPTGCETCSGETDGSGTVIDNDSDNDGVCDADEIAGCQDITACNYNAAATDSAACTFPTGCETCSGETDGSGTIVDNDSDNDGVCDSDEIAGCQDDTACNYNAAATDSAACIYATGCETCSGETDGSGTVIDNDSDNDGVCDADEIAGCQDNTACNYNASATDAAACNFATGCETCSGETDGSGTVIDNDSDNDGVCDDDEVVGCQDNTACNYNASATDSAACIFATGCETCSGETDGSGTVIDNDSDNDGVCDTDEIVGCQDILACNYNEDATDSGITCVFASGCDTCSGEKDGTGVVVDNDSDNDGVCDDDEVVGCQDPIACNFDPNATDSGVCLTNDECGVCGGSGTLGCTDPSADNFDSNAACDDGTCITGGCTYSFALNFNPAATYDDGSCIERIDGCTDNTAFNFDPTANNDDGSCEFEMLGCTDCSADNYDSTANTDDGSCTYAPSGCPGDFNTDGFVTSADLTGFLSAFGQACP